MARKWCDKSICAGSGIFECGQTYVALSRIKSLEGLYLSSFDAKRVRINKKVQDFYEILEHEDAKRRSAEENERKEIEKLPEVYIESVTIPVVEATLVEAIPVAIAEPDNNNNIDFSQFELREEEYTS